MAAFGGSVGAIRALVELDTTKGKTLLHVPNIHGITPIHCAAHFYHLDAIKALVLLGGGEKTPASTYLGSDGFMDENELFLPLLTWAREEIYAHQIFYTIVLGCGVSG